MVYRRLHVILSDICFSKNIYKDVLNAAMYSHVKGILVFKYPYIIT